MAKITMPSEAALQAQADALAADMVKTLNGILRKAANALGETITAAARRPEDAVLRQAEQSWLDAVSGDFFPRVANAYVTSAEQVHLSLIQTYGGPAADVPFVMNSAAVSYLTDAANRMVDVTEGTWSRARAQLIEGFRAGESIQQLATRLHDVAGWSESRAETVARTEIISASNAGALAEIQATGAIAKKTWLATKDSRTREAHRKADGQTVSVHNVFIVDGEALDFPGDPQGEPGNVINCRCTMTFDVKKAELTVALDDLEDVTDEFDPADFVDLESLLSAGARQAFIRRPFDESKVRRNRGRFAPKAGPGAESADVGNDDARELTDDEQYEIFAQFTAGHPLGFTSGEFLAAQAAAVAHNNDMSPAEVLEIADRIGATQPPWMAVSPKVSDYIDQGGSFPDHSTAGDERVELPLPTRTARTSIDPAEESAAASASVGFETGSEFPRLTLRQADAMQNAMFDRSGFWNPREQEALRAYSSGGYLNVNNCLRFGTSCSDSTAATTDAVRESMRPLPQPLSAFRGVDLEALGVSDVGELEGLVGATLNDPGFTSTSVSPATSFDKDVRLQIDVPAGVLGAYIRSVSNTSRENELLLDAGSSFRITDYRPPSAPGEPPYLRLEMVP